QLTGEVMEIVFASDLRIEQVVIGYVVAMHAAFARLQQRRGVAVGNAESVQVSQQKFSIGKAKLGVELQAVSCQRPGRPAGRREAVQALRIAGAFDDGNCRCGTHAEYLEP